MMGITRKIISLEKLVNMYLSKPIKKDHQVRSTNWEKTFLSAYEKLCMSHFIRWGRNWVDASNDCYSGWKVFQVLEAIRMNLPGYQIPIEPPGFYDKKGKHTRDNI
jgi:hypothetical protein